LKQSANTAPDDRKIRSLQAMLAWRLGGVLVVSMSLVIATLLGYFWSAFDDLDDASLQVQAQQISRNLQESGGQLSLTLPDALTSAYRDSGDGFLYAIKDETGRITIASSAKARQLIEPISPQQELPFFFRLPNSRGGTSPYYSLAVALPDFSGHILFVAQGQIHRDVYYDTIINEFSEHIGWTLPVILLLALAIAIWTIRSSLAPLTAISVRASHIGPRNVDIRLPLRNVPKEIRPLVEAINEALARLEQGFTLQRQFTANAAHELRTPLAILNARLDELDNSKTAASLAVDIQRMNRLVEQLLKVSRLDADDLLIEEDVDLNDIAAETVSYLAPLAITNGKSLSLATCESPVMVRGNRGGLGDALRNLVENAIEHSPDGGEILVEVSAEGSMSVRDQGAGIPEESREQIFHRFWRGPDRSESGSGLGLAIVRETAKAHGGTITFENRLSGGVSFTLSLPLMPFDSSTVMRM
jgi:two-component system, OmpR family, sensor histidine kinase TctE